MGNRIYVGNLSFETSELELQSTFAEYGQVSEVKLILDRETGRSRGFAFVTMGTEAEARNAIHETNGRNLGGRELRVNEAEERKSGGDGRGRR